MTLREQAAKTAMGAMIDRQYLIVDAEGAPEIVATLAVRYADALVAKLAEGEAKDQALDLHMTDDDPTSALTDRVVREIQGNPAIRTEYAGVLQNVIIRALRPTVDEWRKADSNETRDCRNCGTCWHHGTNTQLCYKRSLKVRPDMSCPDWGPTS